MSFRVALSGLNAASSDLSVTANNIANANTTGFKGSRAQFADLFATSGLAQPATAVGGGVRLQAVQQEFSQGTINFTNNGLDLAISGEGFFTVSNQGALNYSRDGAFSVDRNGYVVNSDGMRLQGFAPNASGGFNTASMSDINLGVGDSAPSATTEAALGLNLPGDAVVPGVAPFDPTDSDTFNHSTSLTVFDSLGASHALASYFVKTANPNEWELHTTIDGVSTGPATTIEFDSNGQLINPANGEITVPTFALTNGASDLDITVDLGTATQYGDTFAVNNLNQDGFTTGRLVGIQVNEEGIVEARYTNGQTLAISQVAITKFSNPEGLRILGDNVWGETFDSGVAQHVAPGSGGAGLVQAGALEGSNVELTEQLVNMIVAQRNFQANAQMITTQDQVTQTALNIR